MDKLFEIPLVIGVLCLLFYVYCMLESFFDKLLKKIFSEKQKRKVKGGKK